MMVTSSLPAKPQAPSSDPLSGLNDAQRAAVVHGVAETNSDVTTVDTRPLLVIAGAGSGKTNTLAHRVAHLIRRGVDPQRILLLTFSRRAAQEMAHRAESVLWKGKQALSGTHTGTLPWSGTFHAIGARLLREFAPLISLDAGFTILDRGDAEDLMNMVRTEIGLTETDKRFPKKGTLLAIYSRTVNGQENLPAVLLRHFPWCAHWEAELKRLFAAYVEAKAEQNALDYDDLLLYWAEMMSEARIAQELGSRFDHVLVDEYQDTNRLQARILVALKPTGQGVTVVGDDAQSIYGFRGATVRNILDFPTQFGQSAHLIALERNYRSTQGILDVSNAVMRQASERHAKTLWTDKPIACKPRLVLVPDEASQARFVVDDVLRQREGGMALKDQAVLFRASAHSAALELELMSRDVPFVKFGGLKFLEAAHVKDVLAFLRLVENPKGKMSGMRVLQLIPGVGPQTAQRVMERLATSTDRALALSEMTMPLSLQDTWDAFVQAHADARAPSQTWPNDLQVILNWYQPHLERLYDHAEVRKGDLDQLQAIARTYPTRERFLTELTLDPPEATSDKAGPPHRDDDYLILSTIHSAKGQEWKSVSVLNAVDGCIPSDLATANSQEIDEERRLFYVALTRAKDFLNVLVPQKFYVTQQRGFGDKHLYAGRTRFLDDAAVQQMETVTWPPAATSSINRIGAESKVMDIRQRARNAWS